MRTGIYARVSTKDGRQDTEIQLRQLRDFAATQNWTVVHEYIDRASGRHGDREQFQKMFGAASRREFDVLLFWSLDRLSREGTVETLNHLQKLTGYLPLFKASPPLLIIHGQDDAVVPVINAQQLARLCNLRKQIYSIELIPNEGHFFSIGAIITAKRKVEAFLNQHMLG